MHRNRTRGALALTAIALLLGGCSALGIESRHPRGDSPAEGSFTDTPPVQRALKFVVVDVERNELRFMDGERVLWRAPVATGTGFRLARNDGEGHWSFTTPSGTMYVQAKELNPPWFIPDWWYIENKRPIPKNDADRRQEGGLGAAAVFLGDEIAIHGTDKPELLGQRVSHGCIRLANEFALRLFHNVQVGTPVIIVGEQDERGEQPDSVAAFTRSARRVPRPANPLARLATAELLRRLDAELAAAPDTASAWVRTASTLMERGLVDDAIALRGLLSRAGDATSAARREEYATFLADAFSRGALRAVVSLNRISPEARDRAAVAIVEGTMDLWHGPLEARNAPWPTHRVPKQGLGPEGQAGWTALREAEDAYRVGSGRALARTGGER